MNEVIKLQTIKIKPSDGVQCVKTVGNLRTAALTVLG